MTLVASSSTAGARVRRVLVSGGSREVLLIGINAAIFAFLSVMRPDAFASWTNIKAVLSLMTYDLLLAVAMTAVLIVRGLDLSIGAVLALASVVMALLLRGGAPVPAALAAGLLVSMACGLTNGLLIAKAGILPFLVTLGMMSVARGVATVLTTGQYISFPNAPPWFGQFGRYEFQLWLGGRIYGLPLNLVLAVATIALFAILLARWAPLNRFFFVGESPEAARLGGLPVDHVTVAAYLISAGLVWMAAVLTISANRIGYANYGIGAELRALAAAVVGGASMSGGAGSVLGTFLGVLMIALIGNGFVMLNGDPDWQQATLGMVLIAAVGFDALRTFRQRR